MKQALKDKMDELEYEELRRKHNEEGFYETPDGKTDGCPQ